MEANAIKNSSMRAFAHIPNKLLIELVEVPSPRTETSKQPLLKEFIKKEQSAAAADHGL